MNSSKYLSICSALLGAAWLVSAEPAHAGGAKADATEACEDKLANKGYDDVDVDKARKRDGGDKVVVTGEAESGGDTDSVKCVYNTEKDKARIKN